MRAIGSNANELFYGQMRGYHRTGNFNLKQLLNTASNYIGELETKYTNFKLEENTSDNNKSDSDGVRVLLFLMFSQGKQAAIKMLAMMGCAFCSETAERPASLDQKILRMSPSDEDINSNPVLKKERSNDKDINEENFSSLSDDILYCLETFLEADTEDNPDNPDNKNLKKKRNVIVSV